MSYAGFRLGLVCWNLTFIQASRRSPVFRQLKAPSLLFVLALTAGCSMMGFNQMPVQHSPSPAPVPSLNTQAQAPEFLSPKRELSVPDRPEVDTWVRRFSEEKHRSFQIQLDRGRFYVLPVQQIFEEKGLPRDIVFVALVESGFMPTAKSHASAVGMWQFISSTGKRFGLEQNEWVDERRHPFKAARAAADYLSFLYDTFGSWPLALAGYNAGEKAVQGAQLKSGLRSFWELAEGGYLPSETCDYVPKVLATVKIIRDPLQYGFHFDPKHYVQRHETVAVPGGVKLATIEKKAGVPLSSLKECNPELCKPETPPWCSSYELCVPSGMQEMIMSAVAQGELKKEKPALKEPAAKAREVASSGSPATLSYKVNPGETWFSLSKKYGCSPQALAGLNGVTTSSPLKAGQALKVPSNQQPPLVATIQKTANATRIANPAPSSGEKAVSTVRKPSAPIYYPIRKGDTLRSIAERFSVTVEVLCAKNELKPSQKLIPGKVLTIYTSNRDSVQKGR